jgi:hypothetical protein
MTSQRQDQTSSETASYLEMTQEQRESAKVHAALLSGTAARVAVELPLTADVDDFRRVLAARAPR